MDGIDPAVLTGLPLVRERVQAVREFRLASKKGATQKKAATLADMYNPDNDFLFPDLMDAHRALDAVEAAYGVDFGGDEERIVAHLFELYAEKAAN